MKNDRKMRIRQRRRTTPLMVLLGVFLLVYSVSLVLPLLWALLSSLRSVSDFGDNVFGLPNPVTTENYIIAYYFFYVSLTKETGTILIMFPELVVNTLIYSIGCALASTLTTFVVAYLVGRFKNWMSKLIMSIVLICMSIPIVGSLPSELAMSHSLGIHDTFYGIFIMRANFLGMYFLVFVAAVKAVNPAIRESAQIDGANNWQILFKIYVPMLMGTLFTVFLIKFIEFWNEYQVPMLYLPSHPTLSYALNWITVSSTTQELSWEVRKLAACMIVFIPIFTLYVIFNNRINGNITMGGVKE